MFEIGTFVNITGFAELGEGRLDAIYVAEGRNGALRAAGAVKFGLAGRGLWYVLDKLRVPGGRRGFVPVQLTLQADVKYFCRHQRGWIRDGVLLSVGRA